MTLQTTDLDRITDGTVLDRDGDKIGRIADIYLDKDTQKPEWVLVNTGLFGTKETFIPLADASIQGDDTIQVPYEKAFVKDAPRAVPDGELSQQEEAELYSYYGISYSEDRSDSGLPAGGTGDAGKAPKGKGGSRDDAMTRSEEELHVGTVRRPSELVRLKKYVVTEQRQVTVPVQREEVRVEREPITEANVDQAMSGADITESEHEVTLTEEEVDVQKRVVPKERVRLEKDVSTEERTVSEDVRKEKIEVERGQRPKK